MTQQLPLDRIAAVLEELSGDAQRLYDASTGPDQKEERAFWRCQKNAFNKALHYFSLGVRLTPTPSGGYTVPSASDRGATIHRCWKLGGVWCCSCDAHSFHWHTALIAGYEVAFERQYLAEAAASAEVIARIEDLELPFIPAPGEYEYERAMVAAEVDWY